MLCDVTAFLFRAHANYGTWSIDFDIDNYIFPKVRIHWLVNISTYLQKI